jgi:MFS family permease
MCASGAGAVLGSLGVAWLGNTSHKGRIALASLVWLGVGITLFALSQSVALSCVVLFLTGIGLMTVFANVNSLVQLITPNEMRGRVMSVLTGWLVPMFTAPVVLAMNGGVLVLLALYFLLVQRKVAAL